MERKAVNDMEENELNELLEERRKAEQVEGDELDKFLFSRKNINGDDIMALRCDVKCVSVAVIDATAIFETKALGKQVSRTDIVNRILDLWVRENLDKARLILQVAGLNAEVLASLDRRK